MSRTGVVVVVAAADEVVGALRMIHDPMAARGVPAHVTILFPFRSVIDDSTAQQISRIASQTRPFDVTFSSAERFGDEVVYLAPEPAAAFSAITALFVEAFPDCPPYAGKHPDPTPHLTVGSDLSPGTADELVAAIGTVSITTRVDRLILLVEQDDGTWTTSQTWPLGTSR
jgi:2'-5' RNA ligase